MRITLTIILLIFTSYQIFAQTEKGNWGATGSVSLNFGSERTNSGESTFSKVNLSPQVGYFVANNLLLGIKVDLTRAGYKEDTGNFPVETVSNLLGIGSFVKYYTPVKLFVEGYIGYAQMHNKVKGVLEGLAPNPTEFFSVVKVSGINYSAGIGYAIFANDHVAIERVIIQEFWSVQKIMPSLPMIM